MAINRMDAAKLDGLNIAAKALLRAGISPATVTIELANEVAAFEQSSGSKIFFDYDPSSKQGAFKLVDRGGKSYAKVSKPKEVRILSAKIDGVVMSANLHKPGVYHNDNLKVAKALRQLADKIEAASVVLADQDSHILI